MSCIYDLRFHGPTCLPRRENTSIPDYTRWEVEEEHDAEACPCSASLRLLFKAVFWEGVIGRYRLASLSGIR